MIDLVVIYGVGLLIAILLGAVGLSLYQNARARARTRREKQQHASELAELLRDYSEKFLASQSPEQLTNPALGNPTNLGRGAGLALERARELQYMKLPEFSDEMVAALATYERMSDSHWRRTLLQGGPLPSQPNYHALRLDHELAVESLLMRCASLADVPPRAPAGVKPDAPQASGSASSASGAPL